MVCPHLDRILALVKGGEVEHELMERAGGAPPEGEAVAGSDQARVRLHLHEHRVGMGEVVDGGADGSPQRDRQPMDDDARNLHGSRSLPCSGLSARSFLTRIRAVATGGRRAARAARRHGIELIFGLGVDRVNIWFGLPSP